MKLAYQLFLLLSVLLIATTASAQKKTLQSMTTRDLKEEMKSNPDLLILDVRLPQEFVGSMKMIAGAINIPLQSLSERYTELERYKEKDIAVICNTSNRSAVAANFLKNQGFKVRFVQGGMIEFSRK